MGTALITMTGKTADVTDVQKTLIKILRKEGKPRVLIRNELSFYPFVKCLQNNFWLKLTTTGGSTQNIFKKMQIHLVLKMDVQIKRSSIVKKLNEYAL